MKYVIKRFDVGGHLLELEFESNYTRNTLLCYITETLTGFNWRKCCLSNNQTALYERAPSHGDPISCIIENLSKLVLN